MLYLDLDNFKRVNDTLGHAAGDELLCLVGKRLRNALRHSDTLGTESLGYARPGDLARLGGDEFMALLPNLRDADEAGIVAERLDSHAARTDATCNDYSRRHTQRGNRRFSARR